MVIDNKIICETCDDFSCEECEIESINNELREVEESE